MGLGKYFRKRDFATTPEPHGETKIKTSKRLRFVVQKHHASRLHYDFRLELNGVLKSWAVPKGPSLDPHEHRLAMMVEDHPFAYRDFEGTIPKGNYGAGEVMVWDEGYYEPRHASTTPEKDLTKALQKGHLTFVLHGQKLRGEFALIKLHKAQENAWLLVKKEDSTATTDDVLLQGRSVRSHEPLHERSAIELEGYPKVSMMEHIKPMLCTTVEAAFDDPAWLFEIKWDGYRAIATKSQKHSELYSRTGQDFREKYLPISEALASLPTDMVIDGEIVVVDEHGQAHFEWLQNWPHDRQGTLLYYVFDILWLKGHDVRTMPLIERKKLLKSYLPVNTILRYSDHVQGKGAALFSKMKTAGLEGVVAKKASSRYQEGARSSDWLKIKTEQRQEVVIGGFTEPRGGRKYFGSLIVGVYDGDALVYVGHSGGGISEKQRKLLQQKLLRIEQKTAPFVTPPKPNAPVHWVKPAIVCEMSFTEWTKEGFMRHPKFLGMREDKPPKTVRREQVRHSEGASTPTAVHQISHIQFTHTEKIFFPEMGYTKGDLIEYYTQIAPYILPYMTDRPLSLLRQPDGIKGEGFFQKNIPHLPDWLPSVDIYSESNKKQLHWLLGSSMDALLYAIQMGSIEINPWNARQLHLDRPDWAVIDLDPEGVTFEDVITVARTVKDVCDDWKIASYPKTSGKTGIHIYIPLGARYSFEQTKQFAQLVAIEVNRRQPDLTSLLRLPEKRQHKIYLDFLQNRAGQTLAAPYSVRPTPVASVSAPLHWREVVSGLRPEQFTIRTILPRLEKIGDIWQPVMGAGVRIEKVVEQLSRDRG